MNKLHWRNEEENVDIWIFEDMDDIDAYNYIKGKYSEKLAEEVKVYIAIIIQEGYEMPVYN